MKFRKQKIAGFLLITLIFLFLLHTEAKGGEGEEILKKTLETEGMINLSGSCYTASFMKPYEFSNNVRVFWKKPNRIRMEYFAGDTLRMIFITTKDKSWQFSPADNIVFFKELSPQTKEVEKRKQDLLLSNYDVKITGRESIAGRDAIVIKVGCKYPSRPSKKIWIDDKTDVILKSEQYNSNGDLMLLTYFKRVNYNPFLDDIHFRPPQGRIIRLVSENETKSFSPEDLSKMVGFKVVLPSFLPEGYTLEGCYLYRCGCGVDMAHLRYFDGLNSISIFQGKKDCPICSEDQRRGFFRRRMGMMGRRGMRCAPRECELLEQRQERVSAFTDRDLRFVIIGDISEKELNKLAQGLRK